MGRRELLQANNAPRASMAPSARYAPFDFNCCPYEINALIVYGNFCVSVINTDTIPFHQLFPICSLMMLNFCHNLH